MRQSESCYRQLFENAPISIQFIGAEGHFIEANLAFEHYFQVNYNQLRQSYNIFSDPQLVENGTLAYMQRAFAGESVVELPTCFDAGQVVETGQFTYGQSHYTPIRDAQGNVTEIAEITADTTALFAAQQALIQERDRAAQERVKLLSTVAQVANLLLRSQDYTTVLPDVVRLLGEAVECDRCALGQDQGIHPTLNQAFLKINVEWCKPGILRSNEFSSHPDHIYLWDDAPYLYERLKRGEVISCRVADLPEPDRNLFEAQGNTTVLVVPILINDKLWGEMGFDYSERVFVNKCCEGVYTFWEKSVSESQT